MLEELSEPTMLGAISPVLYKSFPRTKGRLKDDYMQKYKGFCKDLYEFVQTICSFGSLSYCGMRGTLPAKWTN